MRDAFINRLSEIAETNPRIMLITADLGFGVLTKYAHRFPKQYLNVGVAEQNMTGIATGIAMEGRIVFTYSIANFPTLRCLEQIRNDACYHNANVKIVSIGGGFSYGSLGISHHATEDISILRALPDITVVVPSDTWETEQATSALVNTQGTCYLRLDKSQASNTNHNDNKFILGKARMIREGDSITLIAAGGILGEVLKASESLKKKGVRCRILSMHTIKPIDKEAIICAAEETGGIITIEEHTIDGGLGSAVAEVCMDSGKTPKVFHRIGLKSCFSSIVGSQEYLRMRYGLDANSILKIVYELI